MVEYNHKESRKTVVDTEEYKVIRMKVFFATRKNVEEVSMSIDDIIFLLSGVEKLDQKFKELKDDLRTIHSEGN